MTRRRSEHLRNKPGPLDVLPFEDRLKLVIDARRESSRIPGLVETEHCKKEMYVPPVLRATPSNLRRPKLETEQRYWDSGGDSTVLNTLPDRKSDEPLSPWEYSGDFRQHYHDATMEHQIRVEERKKKIEAYRQASKFCIPLGKRRPRVLPALENEPIEPPPPEAFPPGERMIHIGEILGSIPKSFVSESKT